jgi:uncharacterized protein (DUF362 family)
VSKVALVKTSETLGLEDSVERLLSLIEFDKENVDRVIIKPNLCYYWKASTGYTTDPRLVEAIIREMRVRYGEDVEIKIAESDASAMKTRYAYRILGYEKLAQKMGVELVNLSQCEAVEKGFKVGDYESTLKIPVMLLECDLFVNVPKLKIMKETQITCGYKNNFGCIATAYKYQYHKRLVDTIIGVNKIISSDLIIVDGVTALGKKPVNLNLVMGGMDIYKVDYVASRIFGYNPGNNPVLRVARREKMGDSRSLTLVGDEMSDFKDIPMDNPLVTRYMFPTLIRLLKLYAGIVGDVIPPIVEDL